MAKLAQLCMYCIYKHSSRLSPGWAFRRHVFRKSTVKKMSTSQKKSSTLPPFQARAPTSSPRPRENSSFSWIRVKLRKFSSLKADTWKYNTLQPHLCDITAIIMQKKTLNSKLNEKWLCIMQCAIKKTPDLNKTIRKIPEHWAILTFLRRVYCHQNWAALNIQVYRVMEKRVDCDSRVRCAVIDGGCRFYSVTRIISHG